MKLHHVFTTWIIFWFSFLILRVNYTVNRKKRGGNDDINDLAVPTVITIKVGLTQSVYRIYTEQKYGFFNEE